MCLRSILKEKKKGGQRIHVVVVVSKQLRVCHLSTVRTENPVFRATVTGNC